MRLFRLFCLGDVPTSAPKTMICNCNTSPSGRTGYGLLDRGATPKSSAANAVQPPCLPAVDLRAGTPIKLLRVPNKTSEAALRRWQVP